MNYIEEYYFYINFNDIKYITDILNKHNTLRKLSFIPSFKNDTNAKLETDINKINEDLIKHYEYHKNDLSYKFHIRIYYDLTNESHNLSLLHEIKRPFNLDLSSINRFKYYDISDIKNLFNQNMPIVELDLSNNIELNEYIDKYELLKNLHSLEKLNLSDNHLCNIISICNIIKNNIKIQELNVSYNKYDSQNDLYLLFEILKNNVSISKLTFYGRSGLNTSNILYLLVSVLQLQNKHINVIY